MKPHRRLRSGVWLQLSNALVLHGAALSSHLTDHDTGAVVYLSSHLTDHDTGAVVYLSSRLTDHDTGVVVYLSSQLMYLSSQFP